MSKFSEKFGYSMPRSTIQMDSIDSELTTSLWNALTKHYWNNALEKRSKWKPFPNMWEVYCERIWGDFFKRPIDTIQHWPSQLKEIRDWFFNTAQWWEIYDFIEFVLSIKGITHDERYIYLFKSECNRVLERELSAWRVVGDELAPITSDEEN